MKGTIHKSINQSRFSIHSQIQQGQTPNIDIIGSKHNDKLLLGGSKFCQPIEKTEKLSRILSWPTCVCINRYFLTIQLMGEISNIIDYLDLVSVEVAFLNIKLQLLIKMRFDIICVNSDHLRYRLFQNISFLFSQRLVVD